jgi:hypothetical protein
MGQGIQLAGNIAHFSTVHPKTVAMGYTEIPVCGHNGEAIRHHGFNWETLAERISSAL